MLGNVHDLVSVRKMPSWIEQVVKLCREGPWIAVEGSLDIKVLTKTLAVDVDTVACPDHPMLVFWLQLPDIFLVYVVNLLLGEETVPVEEVVDSVVVAAQLLFHEYLVNGVGPHLHTPDILTMLHE